MKYPRKMSSQNVIASISRTFVNEERKNTEIRFACDDRKDNEIRFAGEERRDKLYEPKHKQKLVVRVLTVVAYVIFVSMTAILLSLYYTFLWDPKDVPVRRLKPECANIKSPNSLTTPSILNETQIEEMTKSIAVTNEQTILPKLTTTQQQKDVLTFLIEIANASSTSASILTTLEDSQTDSSIEIKETSSNILNSKIK